MKTRFLLIIVGLSIAAIFGVFYTSNFVKNIEDQRAQEEWREIREDVLSEIKKNKISDPICFVVDGSSPDNIGSGITMDTCITLKQFEDMGCTKLMLEHLLEYSNLLDYSLDGPVYLEWVGLPNGVSQEKFDECFDAILEKRNLLKPEPEILKKARDLGIDNTMEAVDSEELSLDEKRQYVKARYEEDGPVSTPSLNIRIKDFSRYLEYGQRPTFSVIEVGYANPCTSPKLEVYSLKQKIGNDHTPDDLIYEDKIIRSCPFFDSFYPILNFWDESDFEPFPICEKEGRYLVVGDSGYERIPLEEYYCGVENEN